MSTPPRSPASGTDLDARKRQLLAALMKEQGIDPLSAPILPLERDRPFYPQSFEQERLWVIDQIEPGSAAYNLPSGLLLIGPLRRDVLEQTFTEVVRRHFVLRTTYGAGPGGEAVQIVQPPAPVRIPVVDLTALPAERRSPEYHRLAFEEAVRPFDLARGPVLRLHLFQLMPRPEDPTGWKEQHVLHLNIHHIASDGWSNGLLMREMADLYSAFLEGRPSPLPELTVQYADFAHWQRKALSGPTLEKALGFWRRQLAGSGVLDLPGDRPRPAVHGLAGAAESLELPREAVPALRELARSEGVTLFMLLTAAYELLLSRYSGQTGSNSFNVGTPVTNRPRTELERLIGFFVNTVVIRADLAGDPTFRELLGRVKKIVLESFAHQQLPFSKVVEAVNPERNLAYTPLFQALIGLGSAATFGMEIHDPDALPPDLPPASQDDLEFQSLGAERDTAMFDLSLSLVDSGWSIGGSAEYRTELFDRSTIRRLLVHYGELLRHAAADPDRRISEIPLLTDAERLQILAEWGQGGAPRPEAGRPADPAAPATPAIIAGGRTVTYGELTAQAGRWAARLRELGVGPETRVGVCLERSPEWVAALLAVLQTGGAYVPLDPAYPRERLAFLVEDSGMALVLVSRRTAAVLPEREGLSRIAWEELEGPAAGGAAGVPVQAEAGREDTAAYVIYTSGSTGRPKGVVVPRRGLANLVPNAIAALGLGPGERFLQFASPSFDASVVEVFATLAAGACLVLPAGDASPSGDELAALLRWQGVTTAVLPPSVLATLSGRSDRPESFPALRVLGLAAEKSPADLVRRWVGGATGRRLVNLYGPTEASVFVTTWESPGAAGAGDTAAPPIGRPVPGVEIRVVDAAGQPVPVGVHGELWVGGAALARGYLGRPDLTAAAFVPDPFSPLPGERLYRTGDLVRWLPDGNLDILGRIDQQVKVRGIRVETGEIESLLRLAPGVAEAAVLLDPRAARLVAFVVVRPGEEMDLARLRFFLRERLPEALVPSFFSALDALPLTPHGKLDRRALALRGSNLAGAVPAGGVGGGEPPATAIETRLVEIWETVLGVDGDARGRIGVHDNFFDLGGHSLLATQVATRIRETLGVELPIRTLFESPTVAELARRVEEAGAPGAPVLELAGLASREQDEEAIPLSFAQERLWLLDQLTPGDNSYNIPVAQHLVGSLDYGALAAALTEVARRHETLRTTFATVTPGSAAAMETTEAVPVQVIHPAGPVPVPLADLSGLPAGRIEGEALRLSQEQGGRPFDLARGPVLRVLLVRLTPPRAASAASAASAAFGEAEGHALLITLHHIAADGWSAGVLVREMTALYAAFAAGRPSPLPPLPVRYADYARWQRRVLRGEALEAELAYWRRELAGVPVLELPTDRPRPASPPPGGATELFLIAPETAAGLQSLARREGATLFMVALAAFQAFLSRLTGQTDVAVGTPVANRRRSELEGLIGFFVNTLVLRGDLSGDPTGTALLGRARRAALDAFAHQDVPFEKLVEEVNPERSLAHTPLFQVMLALQNAPTGANAGGNGGAGEGGTGLEVHGFPAGAITAKFDLNLSLMETPAGLAASLEYRSDLFDPATVRRWIEQLRAVLEALAAAPDRRLSDLPLPGPERHSLLFEANDTAFAAGPERALEERLAAAALARPDAPALTFEGRAYSYAEMDAAAVRLALRLRGAGVGPDVRAAICAERSPEMAAAVLAVLRAGGAYVPLDPAYPAERLRFMLADSGAAILLGHEHLLAGLDFAGPVLTLDGLFATAPAGHAGGAADVVPVLAPRPFAEPGNLAYVIYTSGSTGRPKGVAMTRGALDNLLGWMRREILPEPARTLQFASLSFDPSYQEIVATWLDGGTVVLVSEETRRDPRALLALMARERVERMFLPFVALRQLAEAAQEAALEGPAAAGLCLRDVITAGEALQMTRSVTGWFAGMPGSRLHNHYGPSEAHVVTALDLGPDPEAWTAAWSALPPIGRPIANTQTYLLDAALRPAPLGVVGELWIGGDSLARGYLDRPDLTAERFRPDPWSPAPGGRLYRSGDLSRLRPGGTIDFLGRADDQIKIRGVRVEPGEAEAALDLHPGVRKAVVVPGREPGGALRLVAFYVPAPEAGAAAGTAPEILEFLRQRLPGPLVPSAFVALEAFPLTPSGKVDRRALSRLQPESHAGEAVASPRTPTEELLAGIWAGLLGREGVGVRDSFFNLGGHSLLATQVMTRVRRAFGVDLPLRALFEDPTVERLARRVDRERRAFAGNEPAPEPPLQRVPRAAGEDPPLSFAQQRLWFLDRLEPDSPLYNLFVAVPLPADAADPEDEADASAPVLAACFGEILRRHESLRTTFAERADRADRDGEPVQVIHPPAPGSAALPVVDLTGLPAQAWPAEAGRLAAAEAARPFDLARGPLLRLRLVRHLGGSTLLAALHHIIADGWSLGVLRRELEALYDAFAQGRPSPLPDLPVQYADFAVWQRRWLAGERLDAEIAHWRQRLAGLPAVLELPLDRPRPAVRTFGGAEVPVILPAAVAQGLTSFSRRAGATVFMTLLAAFQALLAHLSGEADLAVGTPIAGRNREEIEDLIGFFVNTLVLRGDLAGDPPFEELVARARETALDAYAHQDLPFEKLVEALEPARSLAHSPLFQVMFALQSAWLGPQGTGAGERAADAGEDGEGTGLARFDLTLTLDEGADGFAGTLNYNTSLFDRVTVLRLADAFVRLLTGAVEEPGRRLSELPTLSAAERHQALQVRRREPMPDALAAEAAAALGGAEVIEPRTPTEAALAEIWRDVLGVGAGGPVSVRDDFFSSGGHSLLAVRLMARIRARFGRDLPLALLFQRPTLEGLAEVLERQEERAAARRVIVDIQPEGEGPQGTPLYFVHAIGGNVLGYVGLARHLGGDRPFLGIQSPDPDAAFPDTLEALASHYIQEARAAGRRAGPWRLGGWSMGAHVAWEMARQLGAQGEKVERLTLVDPPPPGEHPPGRSEAELALSFAGDLAGLQGLGLPPGAELEDVPPGEVLPRLFEGVRAAGLLPYEVGFEDVRRLFETFKRNDRLLSAYQPGPYAGSAALVIASASGTEDAVESWRRLLQGELEVHRLEGDHYSILREPRVAELARILRD